MKPTGFLLTLSLVLITAGCGGSPGDTTNEAGSPADEQPKQFKGTIGVSLLTLQNPFFKVIGDNLTEEAAKFGYDTIVVDGNLDVATQQNQVRDFINRKVAAIVLCPCDSKAIGAVIQEANKAGIPVFTTDLACTAPGAKVVSHIATDNLGGGREAGTAMIEALGETGGKVASIRSSTSCLHSRLARTSSWDRRRPSAGSSERDGNASAPRSSFVELGSRSIPKRCAAS